MLSTTMAPLARNVRWMNWTLEHNPHNPAKPRKVPISPRTGWKCTPNDPGNWCSYDEAYAAAVARGHGLAYQFHEGDGFWFFDLDNCLEADGSWSPLAQHLMSMWGGHVAIEVSQSGKGLHIFGWASTIPPHGCRNIPLNLELYHTDRFVALTDHQSCGAMDLDTSHMLAELVEEYFQKTAQSRDVVDWTEIGAPYPDGPTPDDEKLLAIMLHSGQKTAGAFFNDKHVAFADLWNANEDVLAKKWPGQNGHDAFDRSSADSALASLLAYWTSGNCERMLRFMDQSALKRDKWEDREDYLERTILGACATVTNRAGPREVGEALGAQSSLQAQPMTANLQLGAAPPMATVGPADEAPATQSSWIGAPLEGAPSMEVFAPRPTLRKGTPYLTEDEHQRLFDGCVWVQSQAKVWVPQLGALQDKVRFDVTFGGRTFTLRGDGKTSNSAWEAFTQNQTYAPAYAENICFRPYLPAGCITNEGLLNTWWPVSTPQAEGDASKFIAHLWKLLPYGDDAATVLTYMASILRNPGNKAQWWPVIQGCQGNGKSLLNAVMQYCIGHRYTHLARTSALAKTGIQFNSWVFGKLYLGLEEISLGDKRDFLEDFKDIVTNNNVALEAKGKDQHHGDNFLNGMMFTNHRDAVPITRGDRRYAIFYCAQQEREDLARDGLGGNYFPDLYDWLNGRGAYAHLGASYGFRVVNHWLRNVAPVDLRYDPAGGCQNAPDTTSTAAALVASRGHIEQEVMERVASGAHGFGGGWISSIALNGMLGELRQRLSRAKRESLIAQLGYVPHPGLVNGRANRAPAGLSEVPVLWCRHDHPSLFMREPEAIMQSFEKAQQGHGGAAGLVAA